MMKKILLSVMLVASAAVSGGELDYHDVDMCYKTSALASSLMEARQRGMDMGLIKKRLDNGSNYSSVSIPLVDMASEIEVYEDFADKTEVMRLFAEKVFYDCLSVVK